MPAKNQSILKRLRSHAQKRLVFDPGIPRNQQLSSYKRFLELENKMLKRWHLQGESGREICQMRAMMIDVVIENLFLSALDLYLTKYGKLQFRMAVVATGGFGRAELNPHSDIDIMFLYPDDAESKALTQFQELMAEEILYPLWDLGLKVGHASRNTKEVLKEINKEIQSKNAILESRFICGSQPLFKEMIQSFLENIKKDQSTKYIEQRLKDESERHLKFGKTLYVQEPDIKNGVGGLRDYQNILWIAKIKFGCHSFKDLAKRKLLRPDEQRDIEKAYDFLLRVRNEVHYQNKRPTDKIDLEQQLKIATQLNYTQRDRFERLTALMQDYYSAARTIYSISELLKERFFNIEKNKTKRFSFLDALRAHQRKSAKEIDGFLIQKGVLFTHKNDIFTKDPNRLIRVFRIKQQFNVSLDITLKNKITNSIPLIDNQVINSLDAADSFKAILNAPGEVYPILKEMHFLGVLGRYIPEFGELTCLIQHEYYHRYTADEHVLRTIRHLDNVFKKKTPMDVPYERELRKNNAPHLLYITLLLHDIGKSDGIKGHAESGAILAEPILKRLGYKKGNQKKILFIIRKHLEMARFWQRYDLDDIQTAISFSEIIKDEERLRFLSVHTYCDAKGTAPTLWNNFKNSMHQTLFSRTLEILKNQSNLETQYKEYKAMLKKDVLQLSLGNLPEEEVEAHFSLLPERYFVNTSANEAILHLNMINRLLSQIQNADSIGSLSPIIDWRDDKNLGMSVINIVTWDRAGLFFKLAGALTLSELAIISTRAISRKDHISIDTFYVVDLDGKYVSDPKIKETFKEKVESVLVHGKDLTEEIYALEKKYSQVDAKENKLPSPFPPSVEVYHELSLHRTIIEVQAKDQIALLFKITQLITDKGFDISFARIATERGIAMDTFYIENLNLNESTNTPDLLDLRSEIESIIKSNE